MCAWWISSTVNPPDVMNVSAQPRNVARSSNGTPSSSQIIVIGSGSASPSTMSAGGPCASISSSNVSTTSRACGRSCSTRRAVKVADTSRRMRECPGGSIPRIDEPAYDTGCVRPTSSPTVASRLKRRSLNAVRTSS